MTPEIFDMEQGTPEWYEVRRGIPTASEFHTVMATGRGGGESVTRRKYMLTLIGERMTGECVEGYSNDNMERGKEMEAEARNAYVFDSDNDVTRVGFVRREISPGVLVGCSPDSLVATTGAVEIKTAIPHIHLERILKKRCPPEHVAQVQGILLVTGRAWCDFVSYWPKLPPFIYRVERDEGYIAALTVGLRAFVFEMNQIQESLK